MNGLQHTICITLSSDAIVILAVIAVMAIIMLICYLNLMSLLGR